MGCVQEMMIDKGAPGERRGQGDLLRALNLIRESLDLFYSELSLDLLSLS